nr:hypothetical protein [Tanacetum cinerariifolium]
MLNHQDKYMVKAQVHVSKSFAISDIQALNIIDKMLKHMLRGRLLASFQDLEHEGGDRRSQSSIRFKDNDIKIKIQDHKHANDIQKNSQEYKAPSLKTSQERFTIE